MSGKKCSVWGLALLWALCALPWANAQAEEPSGKQPEKSAYALDNLTITAEKRESSAQDIPVSVSVLSQHAIIDNGLKNVVDLMDMVPNLYITDAGTGMVTYASMRGITGGMVQIPAIGFYVDDVYYPFLKYNLVDIDRIEVLRGPQGTLYGRGAEAGVINIITRKPGNKWQSSIKAEASSFDTYDITGRVSGPLVQNKLGISASLHYFDTRGYFESKFDDADDLGNQEDIDGCISLRCTPTDSLEMDLTYDILRHDQPKYAPFARLDSDDPRKEITVDYLGEAKNDTDSLALRADLSLAGMRLVSITSARKDELRANNDVDFTVFDLMHLELNRDLENISQEFRLLSDDNDSGWQWLVGLFALSEKDQRNYKTWMNFMNMGMGMPGEHLRQDSETKTTALAGFGQISYTFENLLTAGLGLRYDREDKDFNFIQSPEGPVLGFMGYGPKQGETSDTFDAWLPKASVSLQMFENFMPYASISRGFRSGGFNDKENLGSSYKPEFTWNYELGLKTEWLAGRLKVNTALFYIDWSDMQVEVPTLGGASVYVDNAAKAASQGAELEITANLAQGLDLVAGASYTDATYDDYKKGAESFDGKRVIDSPEYTLNLAFTYRFGGGYFVNAGYRHFGKVYFDPANTTSQDNYGLARLKLGYESELFDLYIFSNNLFDADYFTRAFNTSNEWYGRAGEPLTIGAGLSVRF
jgi:iron complex outermembrane receptor protein